MMLNAAQNYRSQLSETVMGELCTRSSLTKLSEAGVQKRRWLRWASETSRRSSVFAEMYGDRLERQDDGSLIDLELYRIH